MEELKQIIRKNGFIYKLVHRTKRVAMYQQWDEEQLMGYEVFLIKVQKYREAFGKIFPKKEQFPGNENFGYSAWSIYNLERATKLFNHHHLLTIIESIFHSQLLIR